MGCRMDNILPVLMVLVQTYYLRLGKIYLTYLCDCSFSDHLCKLTFFYHKWFISWKLLQQFVAKQCLEIVLALANCHPIFVHKYFSFYQKEKKNAWSIPP